MVESNFIPGLELSRRYFQDIVRPILAREMPGLSYAAGLLGEASDVLGYDTARSMDHDWGPRCLIFVADREDVGLPSLIDEVLKTHLPRTFLGFPTGVGFHTDGTTHMAGEQDEVFHHRIRITHARDILHWSIGIESLAELTTEVWVTTPQQKLIELTAGEIFHDPIGEITRVREAFAWYPDDVWRYLMAGTWKNISQLESFIGRCGEVGDDLGSQIVAMRIVRDQMYLAFLQERRYAPYQKWFGTAFSRLEISSRLRPYLDQGRFATSWQEREAGSVGASVVLAERHNDLGLTEVLDTEPRPFWARPFQVLNAERFADALLATIGDSSVRSFPAGLGGIDTYIDSTDAVGNHGLHRAIREWMADGDARLARAERA